MYCKKCHYDLRATEATRCPECGKPFDHEYPSTYLTTLPHKAWWQWVIEIFLLVAMATAVGFLVMLHYAASQSGH